jgi:hypothetical protein
LKGKTMYPLIQILVMLVIVGVILWALGQFPIDATIAKLIRVVLIVVVAIWLIYLVLGLVGSGPILPPIRR